MKCIMLNKVLLTPVDNMVEIVKQNNKCSITFLKNKLNLPSEIIERWLTILEEYKVLNVHYQGLEGYVSVINQSKLKGFTNEIDISKLKENFVERSKLKEMSYEKMKNLWPVFILEYDSEIKLLFYEKAKKIGYEREKIDKAWMKFRQDLTEL